jgi:putative endonuclease
MTTGGDERRRARYRSGLNSERLAALALMLRGYRILARRCQTPYGEIDLIAVRGRRLAFVEVKWRATRAEAEIAVRPRQIERIRSAAAYWTGQRPHYRVHDIGLDILLLGPWRLPVYQKDGLQRGALDWRIGQGRSRR